MSAADMAPGGAAGGGGGAGGGSSGGVLHFVGSCCGELGTNSNQREAQRGVHLRRLCPAPRGKRSRVPPAAPRGREERCGRRPDAGSQALRPPSAKMEDAHFPCAAPSPRAGHGTHARSFEDLGSSASRPARCSRSAPFTHPPLPRRGRERERKCPPCLLQPVISPCQPRGAVSPGESLLPAQGAGFKPLAPFPV